MSRKARQERSAVTPLEIKGSVASNGEFRSNVVLVWNISDTGFCIWTDSPFKKGEFVTFTINVPWQISFECEVRWTKTVPERSGYILGLFAVSNEDKLSAIHREITQCQDKVG